MAGRPLRFLVLLLGGWVGGRTAVLWPTTETAGTLVREVFVGRSASAATVTVPSPVPRRIASVPPRSSNPITPAPPERLPDALPTPDLAAPASAMPGFLRFASVEGMPGGAADPAPVAPPIPSTPDVPVPALPSRWSGSGWLLARGAGVASLAPGGGQIGGSQGGMRLGWAIDPARRLTLVGRLATPLAGIGREASLGIEWRPTRLPVRLVAERRVAVDRGRGGFGAGLIAGVPPTLLALDFRLEGYGQAGAIRRATTEPYADGVLRLSRPLAELGGLRLDLGVGAWGAAQRGAQRLDLGPSLGLTAPIGERTVRLSLDWRQRVAGRATPGSGPALALGSDF